MLLRAREAAQFLRPRQRRAYQVFEEAKQGHLERECVEEVCTKEEAREVFENDPETVSERRGLRVGPAGPRTRASGCHKSWLLPCAGPGNRGTMESQSVESRNLFWKLDYPCGDRSAACTLELLDTELCATPPPFTSSRLSPCSPGDPKSSPFQEQEEACP